MAERLRAGGRGARRVEGRPARHGHGQRRARRHGAAPTHEFLNDLLAPADSALRRAREAGGNRVEAGRARTGAATAGPRRWKGSEPGRVRGTLNTSTGGSTHDSRGHRAQPRRAPPGALPRDRQGALGGARPQPDEGQRPRGARPLRRTKTRTSPTHPDAPQVRERDLPRPVRIRHALERLGPAFVKMGQMLATRRDLVTPDLAAELAKLQDDVPTLPWEEMRARIEAELGGLRRGAVRDVRRRRRSPPPASARSTGPRCTDGTPVAVKVQRPGVTETMEIDLEILVEQARRLEAHTQWGKDFDVARARRRVRRRAALGAGLHARGPRPGPLPRGLRRHARRHVPGGATGTTPRAACSPWTSSTACRPPGSRAGTCRAWTAPRSSRPASSCYFRQIFELGYYHADPHAGNIFALGDGRIAFVDFGRVATISERNRDATFDMLLAVFDDDPAGGDRGGARP